MNCESDGGCGLSRYPCTKFPRSVFLKIVYIFIISSKISIPVMKVRAFSSFMVEIGTDPVYMHGHKSLKRYSELHMMMVE